jgi:hypothetical protein
MRGPAIKAGMIDRNQKLPSGPQSFQFERAPSGCDQRPQLPRQVYRRIRLPDHPEHPGLNYNCIPNQNRLRRGRPGIFGAEEFIFSRF